MRDVVRPRLLLIGVAGIAAQELDIAHLMRSTGRFSRASRQEASKRPVRAPLEKPTWDAVLRK